MRKTINFTKAVVCSALILFVNIPVHAQSDTISSTKNLPNFLFPDFEQAVVKLKSGQVNRASVNYNIVDQEMVFQQDNNYMVLDDPQTVDTLFVGSRIFVPVKSFFYELVMTGPATLFIQHKSEAEPLGTPTAYGVRSQSASGVYHKQFYGPTGSINLKMPDGFKLTDMTEYWARKDGAMGSFTNRRQFLKIFKDKSKELGTFIDQNNINFKSINDLVKLFNYCNELYNT